MARDKDKERHDAIARRVEQERQELHNAPKIDVVSGPCLRCHCCGRFVQQLYPQPYPDHAGGRQRDPQMMCEDCHPEARIEKHRFEGTLDADSNV